MSAQPQITGEEAPTRRKHWSIDIERVPTGFRFAPNGFRYTFHGLGIIGVAPTVEQLARAIERTLRERVS